MEIQKFAKQILFSESLAEKLARVEHPLSDSSPGRPLRVAAPTRPPQLQFAKRRQAPAMPRAGALCNPRKRAIAHHIMANHELQACEVMAFVLCAFPESPADFRRGLTRIIDDEQRHTQMHIARAAALGLEFGDLPVNGYIWKKAVSFHSVLDYLAGLPLTFEGRNLDHTLEFEECFRKAGDERSAAVMRTIHNDEIEHVAFGFHWLRKLKPPGQSDWDAFCTHLKWPLRPAKARGDTFNREPRRRAGMSEDFIARVESATDDD